MCDLIGIIYNMISNRIKTLFEDTSKKPKDLAKYIGVDNSLVYSWLRNENMPFARNIIQMAKFFNCSIEYLIGRTDDNSNQNFKECPPLAQQIKKVMKQRGVSQYRLNKEKIISKSHFYQWEHNISFPEIETLQNIADYLHVTIDYLIGRE